MGADRSRARSYYGRPIVKRPVWTWEVPAYFFAGGIGGASAVLAAAARATGNARLARTSLLVGAAADAASPLLLVSDLGRPERFLNMFRVFKVTSPMSVGSWVLGASGTSSGAAALLDLLDRLPRVRRAAETVSTLAGPTLATYTALILADTAVPAWRESRRELPFVFAASSAASAGAASALLLPPAEAGPARRLAVAGVAAEAAAVEAMRSRLGPLLSEPYRQGAAGRLSRLARALSTAGAGLLATRGRRERSAAVAGSALVLAGELSLRYAVFRAGVQSAADPRYTVIPQRERLAEFR